MVMKNLNVTIIALLTLLIMLTVVLVFSGRVVAQNTCSQPIGGCNYEVDTTGTPSFVSVHAVIVNTMTVQYYGPNDDGWISLQFNPDQYLVCTQGNGYWVQGIIAYNAYSNELLFTVQIWVPPPCVIYPALIWQPQIPGEVSNVPWALVSGAVWYILYGMNSNGMISYVYEQVSVPNTNGPWTYVWNIPSQYSDYWFPSNVVWAGADVSYVIFNSGGSGTFYYCSGVNLYQGTLANNTAENSNVQYTQMFNQYTTCDMYQDFQT